MLYEVITLLGEVRRLWLRGDLHGGLPAIRAVGYRQLWRHLEGECSLDEAVQDDGTFKPGEALQAIYQNKDITRDKEVIAYCRIGERSSHTWFVLKYLLGYPKVRNYDGS